MPRCAEAAAAPPPAKADRAGRTACRQIQRFGQVAGHQDRARRAGNIVFVPTDFWRDDVPLVFHVDAAEVPQTVQPAEGKVDFVQVQGYLPNQKAPCPFPGGCHGRFVQFRVGTLQALQIIHARR